MACIIRPVRNERMQRPTSGFSAPVFFFPFSRRKEKRGSSGELDFTRDGILYWDFSFFNAVQSQDCNIFHKSLAQDGQLRRGWTSKQGTLERPSGRRARLELWSFLFPDVYIFTDEVCQLSSVSSFPHDAETERRGENEILLSFISLKRTSSHLEEWKGWVQENFYHFLSFLDLEMRILSLVWFYLTASDVFEINICNFFIANHFEDYG